MKTCQKVRQLILKKLSIKLKDTFVITHYKGSYYVEIKGQEGKEVSAHCKDCAIVEAINF